MTATAVTCLLGCLPHSWSISGKPIRDRMRPDFAIPLAVVVGWYLSSVSPYRIPLIADGPSPELAILHVQKEGLRVHEAEFSVYLGRKFYFSRDDRRLPQYQFAIRGGHGVLTDSLASRVQALAQSLPSANPNAPLPGPIRAWHAEAWYVRTEQGMFAFTGRERKSCSERGGGSILGFLCRSPSGQSVAGHPRRLFWVLLRSARCAWDGSNQPALSRQ
jgi:hypothetical protein